MSNPKMSRLAEESVNHKKGEHQLHHPETAQVERANKEAIRPESSRR